MTISNRYWFVSTLIASALLAAGSASADELTRMIQEDLTALGYDTGGNAGEMTVQTAVAISRFEAEHNLEVTGEVSPQLAGVIKATKNDKYVPAGAVGMTPPPTEQDDAALRTAQQACLQKKVAKAQKRAKKKRGLGSLMRAVTRTATQFGDNDLAQTISETSYDVYNVNATAADLESAAKDLGLTTEDIEKCRSPRGQRGQK